MKTLIIVLLSLLSTSAIAQTSAIWKGGTPGRETSWNEARNWSIYQVPDENTEVIIKALHTGHHAQPVIDGQVEVRSIELQAGATLTVSRGGSLLIDGEEQYTFGIVNYGGKLVNDGLIKLAHIEDFPGESAKISIEGNGIFILDSTVTDTYFLVKN